MLHLTEVTIRVMVKYNMQLICNHVITHKEWAAIQWDLNLKFHDYGSIMLTTQPLVPSLYENMILCLLSYLCLYVCP